MQQQQQLQCPQPSTTVLRGSQGEEKIIQDGDVWNIHFASKDKLNRHYQFTVFYQNDLFCFQDQRVWRWSTLCLSSYYLQILIGPSQSDMDYYNLLELSSSLQSQLESAGVDCSEVYSVSQTKRVVNTDYSFAAKNPFKLGPPVDKSPDDALRENIMQLLMLGGLVRCFDRIFGSNLPSRN